jgi:hypothetical protein
MRSETCNSNLTVHRSSAPPFCSSAPHSDRHQPRAPAVNTPSRPIIWRTALPTSTSIDVYRCLAAVRTLHGSLRRRGSASPQLKVRVNATPACGQFPLNVIRPHVRTRSSEEVSLRGRAAPHGPTSSQPLRPLRPCRPSATQCRPARQPLAPPRRPRACGCVGSPTENDDSSRKVLICDVILCHTSHDVARKAATGRRGPRLTGTRRANCQSTRAPDAHVY